jgi:3-deoxy-D-manno-octulosonic-acid transferase
MLWLIYNLLFPIGFLILLPRFVIRMARRGGYMGHFGERFAYYAPGVRKRLAMEPRRIWIHGVSVGEMFVALRFTEEYRRRHPETRFVISTTTSTGRQIAEKNVLPEDVLIYFPLDFPWVVRRALNAIRPAMLVLVECELWPNLIRQAKDRGLPVVLINGRLSEHSYRGYRKLRWVTRRILAQADLLCVQSETERRMFLDLGADGRKVHVLDSAKYDISPPDNEDFGPLREVFRAAGIAETDLVLVGGSTWAGEETALLEAYKELKASYPRLKLVLVPRHAERSDEVEKEIERFGFKAIRRSNLPSHMAEGEGVLLVDTTGELRKIYHLATLIFVGKSLTQRGGQNIIEPAWCGKPILVGPHMENFPVIIRDFLEAGAIVQVRDAAELKTEAARLLSDESLRHELGRRALDLVRRKTGAIRRTIDLIERTCGLSPKAIPKR